MLSGTGTGTVCTCICMYMYLICMCVWDTIACTKHPAVVVSVISPPAQPMQDVCYNLWNSCPHALFATEAMYHTCNTHRRLNNTVLFIIMYVQYVCTYVQLLYSGNYNFLSIFDENRI